MNIWKLECSGEVPWTAWDGWGVELNRSLYDGIARIDSWVPFELYDIPEVKGSPDCDVAYFYGGLQIVVNAKTKDLLQDYLGQDAEFLPVSYHRGQYWLLNALCVLNCLDYDHAKCSFFSDGRPIRVSEYAFVPESLKGHDIFRIEALPQAGPFVTDAFKRLIEENDVKGFSFKHVWKMDDLVETEKTRHAAMGEEKSAFDYVGELDQSTMGEIREASERAAQLVKPGPGASPEQMVEEVCFLVDAMLSQCDESDEVWIPSAAMSLGCLYGDAICREYGWRWMAFGPNEHHAFFGVVSPERNYCLVPTAFILKILKGENVGPDGQNDNTVALLFGMLDGIDGRPGSQKMIPLG